MGERRGVFWVLAGKPEGKKPLGRSRRRWENNIKIIIIIFINCNWVVTRWQWLFYMYTNIKKSN